MESSEALDRMREKHARALDQLHMMLAREMALKAAASDGQAAREEARQLRRRLETLEETERESGRLVRDLQVQIKEVSAELAAAHERGERLHAVTEELEVLDARNRTTEAARTRLQAENAELRRQLAASQASPPSAPAPPAPAQNTTATQTTAVWPDVDAALAREKAAGADQLAEMREAVKDLAARLKRSNAEKSRAVEEQRALEAELQRFRSAGGSVDAALRRENAELLAQIEEMRAAQRKFLRGPSRTVPAAPPRSRRLPGQ